MVHKTLSKGVSRSPCPGTLYQGCVTKRWHWVLAQGPVARRGHRGVSQKRSQNVVTGCFLPRATDFVQALAQIRKAQDFEAGVVCIPLLVAAFFGYAPGNLCRAYRTLVFITCPTVARRQHDTRHQRCRHQHPSACHRHSFRHPESHRNFTVTDTFHEA